MMSRSLPYVAVIMPIYNEEAFIARSLGAVLGQDYPGEHVEILVVDGMSTDRTREIVTEIQSHVAQVQLLDNPDKIVSAALNIGVNHARGSIIILVGGHCEIASDYISRCVEFLQAHPDISVVGGVLETIGETATARTIALAMSSPFGVGGATFRIGGQQATPVDTVAFGAYRREAIETAGAFDEELVRNQDDEYNYRIRKLGGSIYFVPSIKTRYYSRGTLTSLWQQYFQYGFWKVRVLQKHPFQMHWRQFVPPLFLFTLVFLAMWALFSTEGLLGLVLLALSYLLANLLASFITAAKSGWRYFALLPIVFSILHLSYGSGFWAGLLRFLNRWGE